MNVHRSLQRRIVITVVAALLISLSLQQTFAAASTVNDRTVPGDTTITVSGVPLKPEDISPLLIGESIPMAILPDAAGKPADLQALVAQKPTILVFYRGGWCPYCNKQLAGLQQIEKELNDMGYQLIAVSTDSPDNLKQTENKQKLSYTLLSDANLELSKKFGIAYKAPKNYDRFLPETSGGKNADKLLPVPAVFILTKKGKISFEYINPDMTQRIGAGLLKAAAAALVKEL